MEIVGLLWSLAIGIIGWAWWGMKFLYTAPFLSIIMTIVTIGVLIASYGEFTKAGGGIAGALSATRYAVTNFPRIAYETVRWTLRIALIDLPRIIGKDVSGALPESFKRWLGEAKNDVRVVEKVVHTGAEKLSLRARARRRLRHFIVDALIVSALWNWSFVYSWIQLLFPR
jgi:hypothetical protein